MKIRKVKLNNRKKAFVVNTWSQSYEFPYTKAVPCPTKLNPITDVHIDKELGSEGFTFVLKDGAEGSVHIEQILEYNQDPGYMRDLLLYKLTVEAQKRVGSSGLSKREIIRRLGTSPAQFYRLLDNTNYKKSVDKVLFLLHVLDCEIELIVRDKSA